MTRTKKNPVKPKKQKVTSNLETYRALYEDAHPFKPVYNKYSAKKKIDTKKTIAASHKYAKKRDAWVADQLMQNVTKIEKLPDGHHRVIPRGEILERFTPEEQKVIGAQSKYQPSKWHDFIQGMETLKTMSPGYFSVGKSNPTEHVLKDKSLSNYEKQQKMQSYIDSPKLTALGDAAGFLAPLELGGDIVKSGMDKLTGYSDYSFKDAVEGRKHGDWSSMILDPLNSTLALKGIGAAKNAIQKSIAKGLDATTKAAKSKFGLNKALHQKIVKDAFPYFEVDKLNQIDHHVYNGMYGNPLKDDVTLYPKKAYNRDILIDDGSPAFYRSKRIETPATVNKIHKKILNRHKKLYSEKGFSEKEVADIYKKYDVDHFKGDNAAFANLQSEMHKELYLNKFKQAKKEIPELANIDEDYYVTHIKGLSSEKTRAPLHFNRTLNDTYASYRHLKKGTKYEQVFEQAVGYKEVLEEVPKSFIKKFDQAVKNFDFLESASLLHKDIPLDVMFHVKNDIPQKYLFSKPSQFNKIFSDVKDLKNNYLFNSDLLWKTRPEFEKRYGTKWAASLDRMQDHIDYKNKLNEFLKNHDTNKALTEKNPLFKLTHKKNPEIDLWTDPKQFEAFLVTHAPEYKPSIENFKTKIKNTFEGKMTDLQKKRLSVLDPESKNVDKYIEQIKSNEIPANMDNKEFFDKYLFSTEEKEGIEEFMKKNAEFDWNEKLIRDFKKKHNIQYNPQDAYDSGTGFYHFLDMYYDSPKPMKMLEVIDKVKKGGDDAVMSATTASKKRMDNDMMYAMSHKNSTVLEVFPESDDILWAAKDDVHSGSTGYQGVFAKNLLRTSTGSFSKSFDVVDRMDAFTPNLGDLAGKHSLETELGITLTKNNFRFKTNNENLIEEVAKANKHLDDTYGKIKKPVFGEKPPAKTSDFDQDMFQMKLSEFIDSYPLPSRTKLSADKARKILNVDAGKGVYSIPALLGLQQMLNSQNSEDMKNKNNQHAFGVSLDGNEWSAVNNYQEDEGPVKPKEEPVKPRYSLSESLESMSKGINSLGQELLPKDTMDSYTNLFKPKPTTSNFDPNTFSSMEAGVNPIAPFEGKDFMSDLSLGSVAPTAPVTGANATADFTKATAGSQAFVDGVDASSIAGSPAMGVDGWSMVAGMVGDVLNNTVPRSEVRHNARTQNASQFDWTATHSNKDGLKEEKRRETSDQIYTALSAIPVVGGFAKGMQGINRGFDAIEDLVNGPKKASSEDKKRDYLQLYRPENLNRQRQLAANAFKSYGNTYSSHGNSFEKGGSSKDDYLNLISPELIKARGYNVVTKQMHDALPGGGITVNVKKDGTKDTVEGNEFVHFTPAHRSPTKAKQINIFSDKVITS